MAKWQLISVSVIDAGFIILQTSYNKQLAHNAKSRISFRFRSNQPRLLNTLTNAEYQATNQKIWLGDDDAMRCGLEKRRTQKAIDQKYNRPIAHTPQHKP